jgi:pimeloyl-ACP methyl ester carboxylesterase
LPDATPIFPRDRTLIFPRNPTLTYSLGVFRKAEMMTLLDYTKIVVSFLDSAHEILDIEPIVEADIVAWSMGGFMRNYLDVEWKKGRFRREFLIEPMGTPTANAVASTYNLLPLREAFRRACGYCPQGSKWHHLLVLVYLRWHVHTRPLHTEPFWNKHSQGRSSLNRKDVMFLLSRDDIVTVATAAFIEQHLPNSQRHINPGGHGAWCMNHLKDCLDILDNWINTS